jgi:carboxylesterase type B
LAAIGASEKLPCIVWIHGGAYVVGSAADTPVDLGATLADGGIVYITINYRLGVFGFLGSSNLAGRSTSGAGAFGNYGIEDQRMALKWVKANIAAFGGDPSRVTIIGESAGGGSVLNHLVQKGSFGLYSAAAAWSAWPYAVPSSHAERQYQTVLSSTKCDTLSCLTNLPASAFNVDAIKGMSFGPVVDGVVQTDTADEMIRQGHVSLVPTIITNVKDEAAPDYNRIVCINPPCDVPSGTQWPSFVRKVLTDSLVTESEMNSMPALLPFRDRASARLSCMTASVLSLYSNYSEADSWTKAAQIQADVPIWGLEGPCYTRRRAKWIQASGMKSVFAAQFAYDTTLMYTGQSIYGLVSHGDDVRVLSDWPPDAAATFASAYWGYFVQFAKTGDPNGVSAASTLWPTFNERNARLLIEGPMHEGGLPNLSTASDFLKDQCDYWDTVYALVTSNPVPPSFAACVVDNAAVTSPPTMPPMASIGPKAVATPQLSESAGSSGATPPPLKPLMATMVPKAIASSSGASGLLRLAVATSILGGAVVALLHV